MLSFEDRADLAVLVQANDKRKLAVQLEGPDAVQADVEAFDRGLTAKWFELVDVSPTMKATVWITNAGMLRLSELAFRILKWQNETSAARKGGAT